MGEKLKFKGTKNFISNDYDKNAIVGEVISFLQAAKASKKRDRSRDDIEEIEQEDAV